MAEYIDTSINPADYIEVWEVEDAEHGKQLVMAVDDLKYLPPADVRPVRRGRWVKYETGGGFWYYCSVCKGDALLKGWGLLDVHLSSYCPNCGADMRGGDADGSAED